MSATSSEKAQKNNEKDEKKAEEKKNENNEQTQVENKELNEKRNKLLKTKIIMKEIKFKIEMILLFKYFIHLNEIEYFNKIY